MNVKIITRQVKKISDLYARKFGIKRDGNWYVLKLQEEMGELIQSYLMMKGRARQKDKTKEQIENEFRKEMADVFCHVLLLAKHYKINLEKEVNDKWLVWEQPK